MISLPKARIGEARLPVTRPWVFASSTGRPLNPHTDQ
jgi:hypothetical protein